MDLFTLSGTSILWISAAAPVVIFTRLFAGKYGNLHFALKFRQFACPQDLFPQLLESEIKRHFRNSLDHHIDVDFNGKTLRGYFKAFENGEYIFYSHQDDPLIHLKKDARGWALVQICDGDEGKRRFVTLLILHLESKLFN
ncbi:MAG TPA: hypothetical protein VGC08_02730 [Pedobacter sp.]